MKNDTPTDAPTGAVTMLRGLRQMGVDTIFASPGSDWAPLWEALAMPHGADEFPRYISSRHEETAIAMATGYAKSTRKLVAVVIHTTVGALHATMAMRAAVHEHIPMVVFAGESIEFAEPSAPHVGPQWLRVLADVGGPTRLVEPNAKWSASINSPLVLPGMIARACQLAMAAPRGPVFLSVPFEILLDKHAGPPHASVPANMALPSLPAPNAAAIAGLAGVLITAKRPLIITEELGRNPRAVAHLVALAECLGAPVLDAWYPHYANFPRDHPLYGGLVSDEMPARVNESDCVLLVESVAPWHPPAAAPTGATRIAAIGEDPLNARLPLWNFRTDYVIPGDAEAALAALAEAVKRSVAPGARSAVVAQWAARHEAERSARHEAARATGAKPTIETRWVAHELNAVMPADAILVNESITHRVPIHRHIDRLGPGAFFEAAYGGLGMGIGTALGVKVAHPNRPVVLTIGDGSFHYNPVVGSFGAAQEHRLPLVIVLFDNAGYASQKGDVVHDFPAGHAVQTQRFAGTSILPRPDYPLLARAYGGWGETVRDPAQLRAALQRGFDAAAGGQLALVHVVLDQVNPHER